MEATITEGVFESLRFGVGFLWTAAWEIIMGLTITSLVQVYISHERMAGVLGTGNLDGITKVTLFGAASGGCSFGTVAIGKGLFKKGAAVVNFLAFMFASTNLIVELGLMILILLGWEFLVAELVGGLILISVMALIVHVTLPETLFEEVRRELNRHDHGHGITEDPTCGMEGTDEFSLVTDGGKRLQFCSAGCMETYEHTFETPGTYDYYCIPHKTVGMVGRIVVGSPGGPAEDSPIPDGEVPSSDDIVQQGAIAFGTDGSGSETTGGGMMGHGGYGMTSGRTGRWLGSVPFVGSVLGMLGIIGGALYLAFGRGNGTSNRNDRAIETLEERYERGEFDEEEFRRRREVLESSDEPSRR